MATIKSKIIVNVVIVLLTVTAIVAMNYFNLHKLKKLQDNVAEQYKEAVLAEDAANIGPRLATVIASAEINRDLDQSAKEWAVAKEKEGKILDELGKKLDTAEEKDFFSAGRKAFDAEIALFEGKMVPLLQNSKEMTEEIRKLDGESDHLSEAIRENLEKIATGKDQVAKQSDDQFDADIIKTITESLIIGLVGILFQAGLAGWLLTTIMRPLNSLKVMLLDISQGEGDLTKRLDDSTKDELAEISRYFNQFIEKLKGIIGQIAQATVEMASASVQLHATAEQMATGVEEVAAQAGTVATAGEEMSATSGDIAQNCQFAAEGSQHASSAAVSGAKVVDETIVVMNSIAERVKNSAKAVESLGSRSDQIGEIVGTIEDIADQTNLLALNAAIEAARAGEQGRGFAVVADEVRALAERTTRATREIGEMIKAIQSETKEAVIAMEEGVSEVAKGSEKAAESGKALEQILEQINSVTTQIAQVATAAEEQTATTSEISSNMQQITEVVSQTASGAEESAAAANQLSTLAEDLKRIVGQFKLA